MTIHTQKLPAFALYAAHADEFGVTVFGSCRDEALNNLAEELRLRHSAGFGGQVRDRQSAAPTPVGQGSGQLAPEGNRPS